MGIWSPGIFENDDATEWVGELAALSAIEDVTESLLPVIRARKKDALESSDCARALAAAEVISAAAGRPASDLPPEIDSWIEALGEGTASPEALESAIRAVHRVRANEELRDLFDDPGEYETWRENLDDLETRLGE